MSRPKLKNRPNYISKSIQFTEKDWKRIEKYMKKNKLKKFSVLARNSITACMAVHDGDRAEWGEG